MPAGGMGTRTLARAALFVLGLGILCLESLNAHGGADHLFEYSAHVAHKFTAQAMLHGTLALHRGLQAVTMNDEQVYNGAGFTNWGFGVPLLQIPFHAAIPLLRRAVKSRVFPDLFPDRFIFFIYLIGLLPLLWTSFQRSCSSTTSDRRAPLSTWVYSWSVTLLVLAYALFPLLSFRFIVYEETVAYFVVAELYALSFYIRFLHSKRTLWLSAAAIAASLGLLIRPTGLPYMALWAALVVLHDRRWRTAAIYCAVASPVVAFWLYSNWVKGGSPFTLGYQNGLPEYPFHYPMIRFGQKCAEPDFGVRAIAKALLESFFVRTPDLTPVLAQCHFVFETRGVGNGSFFPPAVFVLLCGSFLYYVVRREPRLACYLPHLAFVALFFAFSRTGFGFAYRYTGDFWPVIVLILAQIGPALRLDRRRLVSLGLAMTAMFYSVVGIRREVIPAVPSIEVIDAARMTAIDEEYQRMAASDQSLLPSRIKCGEPLTSWPRANGKGWGSQCEVDTFTNVFLGVRKRADTTYHLRFKTDYAFSDSLRVYVNGKNYTAHREAGEYVAEFPLHYDRMYSPAIMVTVEWTQGATPPTMKFLEMEVT
jgi:MFS family permease